MLARVRLNPWRSLLLATAILATTFALGEAAAPPAAAVGPTYVSGPIGADTTWTPADSPYIVYGHATVEAGVILTILPGTIVKLDPLVAIFVEGTLLADATMANPILFQPNQTLNLIPWIGIQFNATSTGSVSWSSFERPWRAVVALDASPAIHNNTVRGADRGFHLSGSSSLVADNVVNRAGSVGIYLEGSDAQVRRNWVNGTSGVGIEAVASGSPVIAENLITNLTGLFAFGIEVVGGANAEIRDNVIRGIRGRDGSDATLPGNAGTGGGYAVGMLVTGAPTATIVGNTIDQLIGGRGGDGFGNVGGVGGRGGAGGAAAGIAISGVGAATIQWNTLTSLVGGRGGNGGGGAGTLYGGDGGIGGDAWGIQLFTATASAVLDWNSATGLSAGDGGHGGDGTPAGNGSAGGNVLGLFFADSMQADATGNILSTLRGGLGGNSTSNGLGTGRGGAGGSSTAIAVLGIRASAALHGNDVSVVRGGDGGRGRAGGGDGGNGTGILAIGNNDGAFNGTSASAGTIQDVQGGDGGSGGIAGGDGGTAVGLAMGLVTGTTAFNAVAQLRGGFGGDAASGQGGRGGDATGFGVLLVPSGLSTQDSVDTSTGGAAGLGGTPLPSYGVGMYFEGNASITTRATIDNGTLVNVGSYDLYAENYSDVTTISTPFAAGGVRVSAAANLTVRNFLSIDAVWPDGSSLVAGATIRVEDNGAAAWDFTSPTGQEAWLLVTDRVYINSNVATENTTTAMVSYLPFTFANSPRSVDMSSDRSEVFVMVDEAAPSSSADSLPTYETVSSFPVSYTASDGLGVGLRNVTLWYRLDGGAWTEFATQPAAGVGSFSFTAASDGLHEFATIVDDQAGNTEPGPFANDTWTIVDTAKPDSRVLALPTYETTASFLVSWAPEPGVTDIATYRVQYNRGAGWIDWLPSTALTSATFTATPAWGVYQFRSIATDYAGNVEVAPAGNDTWTIVDTLAPFSRVLSLSPYQTTLDFLVSWQPQFDSIDIASYRIDVNDDGAGWIAWIPSTTLTSSIFTGVDGHTYQFRSVSTDYAGNVEAVPAGNDTWTIVDVTAPSSSMAGLPPYVRTLTILLSWGAQSGTTDIASYTIEVSDDGGVWTAIPAYVNTTATSGSYVGVEGHRYAFRSIARDRAGNVEAPTGNDTWTTVDTLAPSSAHSLAGTSGANGWYRSAVAVTLTSTDATSGLAVTAYRIDGGAWQTYSAPFVLVADGSHTVEYYSTDVAGNIESAVSFAVPIDTVAPATSMSASGTAGSAGWYLSSVFVTLTPSDATSGVNVTSYRVDGGSWQTYAAPFIVSGDGSHTLEYYSVDGAGLTETAISTTLNLDGTRPSAVSGAPRGSNVNTTPVVIVTFSEPMDRASTETAFRITPEMNGQISWSADSRTLTFTPERPLDFGTSYAVFIDSSAKDVAGNAIAQSYTFSFSTVAAPPTAFGLGDAWPYLLLVAAVAGGGLLFVLLRRRTPTAAAEAAKKPVPAGGSDEAAIDDVFLLYRKDGVLIKHETRRLRPDIDTDILSGMLTAVQQFVRDSFQGDEEGELDEITVGQMHLHIGRGKWLIIAARVSGGDVASMNDQIKRCIQDMEDHNWDRLEDWDGDMELAKALSPYVRKLIRGDYA